MQYSKQEVIITIVGVIGILLFLGIMFLVTILYYNNKKLNLLKEKQLMTDIFEKQLLKSQIEVHESTLSTLSKELHDNIGQLLSTAKMLLGITERSIANPPDTLKTANETVGKAINELRSLSKSLSKEWLEQFDLIENLTAEISRLNTGDDITLHLSQTDRLPMKADEQIILFRIIQEAIQNAIKHASAKNIFININIQNAILTTFVNDDGKGFDQNEKPGGVGILNMRHRTKLLGGTIEWKSSNEGSTVLITLPVKADEQ